MFAPLAVEVGAKRMNEMAVRYGFNRQPVDRLPRRRPACTRKADSLTSDLQLGVTGIGQGGVVATPLQMASVAQAIAVGAACCIRRTSCSSRISGSDREPRTG